MRIYEWNKGVADAKGMNKGPGKINGKKSYDIPAESGRVRQEEDSFRSSLQRSMHVRMETNTALKTGKEVPVREIPYSECDMVEINVLEGYVLKARRERAGEGEEQGGQQVYVEKKNDEGEVKAYLFHGSQIRQDGGDEMERMAYAVMNQKGR